MSVLVVVVYVCLAVLFSNILCTCVDWRLCSFAAGGSQSLYFVLSWSCSDAQAVGSTAKAEPLSQQVRISNEC